MTRLDAFSYDRSILHETSLHEMSLHEIIYKGRMLYSMINGKYETSCPSVTDARNDPISTSEGAKRVDFAPSTVNRG